MHAQRVMAAYQKLLGESAELELLRLVGLFDKPVPRKVLEELRKGPAITGATGRLTQLEEGGWAYVIEYVEKLGLVNRRGSGVLGGWEALDAHPLAREYFHEEFRSGHPAGYREVCLRLCQYFRQLPEKEQPDTLEELEPLFSAVAFGCRGGQHQEVFVEVFWKRIRRGDEYYTTKKLGAYASDLSAISHFFVSL